MIRQCLASIDGDSDCGGGRGGMTSFGIQPSRREVLVGEPITDDAKIISPALKVLWQYWTGLNAAHAPPLRSHVDPMQVKAQLPKILICEWDAGEEDFLYRICGGDIDAIHGVSGTGKSIRQIWPGPIGEAVMTEYRLALDHGTPVLHQIAKILHNGTDLSFERVLMPLSKSGDRVDMLLGGIDTFSQPGRALIEHHRVQLSSDDASSPSGAS